jgi:hypothetical protein
VELLAPAGTPEKLEIAVHYGADAVYLAGKDVQPEKLFRQLLTGRDAGGPPPDP